MSAMPDDTTERRHDHHLRESIDEYRKVAAQVEKEAASCKDATKREQYLTLAKSLMELIDSLQGRPSKPK